MIYDILIHDNLNKYVPQEYVTMIRTGSIFGIYFNVFHSNRGIIIEVTLDILPVLHPSCNGVLAIRPRQFMCENVVETSSPFY